MVAMKTVYGRIKVFEGFRSFVDGHVKDLKYHDLIADGTGKCSTLPLNSARCTTQLSLRKKLPPCPGGPLNNHNAAPSPPAPHQPPAPSAPRPSSGPSFPDLPAVPTDLPNLPDSIPGGNSAGGEDVDLDDPTRRFEDLKKKK